jgi:hypothetical protein
MDEDRPWITAAAVAAVAAAALATAWVSTRPLEFDNGRPAHPLDMAVVKAPRVSVPATAVLGASPARAGCAECGIVEAIRAVDDHAAFELVIRMADGSLRTVTQAAPVLAGSEVTVRGGVAFPVADATLT